jgi:hypothetical protein
MHLAELYGIETRALNQAVKRNINRFPDFMFQIREAEAEQLVSQNVIRHKKFFGGSSPYAFVLIVLNSDDVILSESLNAA